MAAEHVPQPLGEKIEIFLDPEAAELVDLLRELIHDPEPPDWAAEFTRQWNEMRATRWMTTETWRYLTGKTFPDQEALYAFIDDVSERIGLP
jgi:hypothetical protein